MRRALLWTALALAGHGGLGAEELLLEGGMVLDPRTRTAERRTLLLRDGKVAAAPAAVPEDFTGRRLDLSGKWVIPGLHDLHTHSYGNGAPGGASEFVGTPRVARRALYAGVTGFLDLFGLESALIMVRASQRAGKLPGADVFASLSCLTATNGHCTEYGIPTRVMDTPEDARRQVSGLAANKPDVVKIVYHHTPAAMPSIDRATLAAAVETAAEHGLRTVVHVGSWQDVRDAIGAGASAMTHVPRDGVVPDDVVGLVAKNGTWWIPTLTVHCDSAHFRNNPEALGNPLLAAVAPESVRRAYLREGEHDDAGHRRRRAAYCAEVALGSVRKLAAAGVPILSGTDAGNVGVFQGYSVHRELALLVKAGLTPWQALAASTTLAGDFLGRSWGVAEGDEASLVVLDASPIDDIRNTETIHLVIHHGEVVDRDALLAP